MTESSSSYCIKIDNNKDRLSYSSAEISTKEKLEEHIKLLDAKIDWASNQVQFFSSFLIRNELFRRLETLLLQRTYTNQKF